MSCPICSHDGAKFLDHEVKRVQRPWPRTVKTGVILGCTKCSAVRIERNEGSVFLLNCLKSRPPQIDAPANGDRMKGKPRMAHDQDMRWNEE